jgi:hypothetical protein
MIGKILEFPVKSTAEDIDDAEDLNDEHFECGFDTTATGCRIKIDHSLCDGWKAERIECPQPHLGELDADEIIEILKRVVKTAEEREILREAVARYNSGDWTDAGGTFFTGRVEVGTFRYWYHKSCAKWHRFEIQRVLVEPVQRVNDVFTWPVKPLYRKNEQFDDHEDGVTAAILSCVYNAVTLEHFPEREEKPRRKKEKVPPPTPPEIAKLFDRSYVPTPREQMVIDLILTNDRYWNAPYETPEDLGKEAVHRIYAYQKKLGITDENPYGTKSMENTCGYCGKRGFRKIVDPKTHYTHNQKCDACGGNIMIDSWYYKKHFGK